MTSFSLQTFRDFCASKPTGEVYPYTSPCDCAMGQFERSEGREPRSNYVHDESAWKGQLAAEGKPRTFGALTCRLDALLERAP